MPVVRLFAQAREAAGVGRAEIRGDTVGAVVAAACERFGPEFTAVVSTSRIWLNGQAASNDEPVAAGDEVAVLPPVSGGCGPLPSGGAGRDRWCVAPTDRRCAAR